ncbi:MAG TPA: hypothetical protein VFV30_10955 [Novosphingobium sp.]|nr:hypothetical protein [Novosphingobium sp.]
MRADKAQIRRLQRIERLRALARQDAARAAAQAEGTLAQLVRLSARTGAMRDEYGARTSIGDGLALLQHHAFVSGLSAIHHLTSADATQARSTADRLQQELSLAERRRAAVEQRIDQASQALAQRGAGEPTGSRRATGTLFE